jgi:hypothetical protein
MQRGQSFCNFYLALPYSWNSVWSAPPPARRGNSVLSTALCLTDQLQDLLLLPHFGKLVCLPTPALSLCASLDLCWVLVWLFWEVDLPHPHSQPLLPFHVCSLSSVLKFQLLASLLFSGESSAFYAYFHYQC